MYICTQRPPAHTHRCLQYTYVHLYPAVPRHPSRARARLGGVGSQRPPHPRAPLAVSPSPPPSSPGSGGQRRLRALRRAGHGSGARGSALPGPRGRAAHPGPARPPLDPGRSPAAAERWRPPSPASSSSRSRRRTRPGGNGERGPGVCGHRRGRKGLGPASRALRGRRTRPGAAGGGGRTGIRSSQRQARPGRVLRPRAWLLGRGRRGLAPSSAALPGLPAGERAQGPGTVLCSAACWGEGAGAWHSPLQRCLLGRGLRGLAPSSPALPGLPAGERAQGPGTVLCSAACWGEGSGAWHRPLQRSLGCLLGRGRRGLAPSSAALPAGERAQGPGTVLCSAACWGEGAGAWHRPLQRCLLGRGLRGLAPSSAALPGLPAGERAQGPGTVLCSAPWAACWGEGAGTWHRPLQRSMGCLLGRRAQGPGTVLCSAPWAACWGDGRRGLAPSSAALHGLPAGKTGAGAWHRPLQRSMGCLLGRRAQGPGTVICSAPWAAC
ncbi:hypothetical protein NDU88_000483 [Pleurodeles waltl]|uniref:Uncharacterized protein n=1 Tax=Pleurodeles waltl TaxID=8319 RepID=A0AAV7MRZ7_PLEWA|nr:hypothetical protein NDU88_000483 [Pleurodeles waltl]